MPNLIGENLQDAQNTIQRLTAYGIAITYSSDASGQGRSQVLDRNWKVCAQNVKKGATITPETRIEFEAVKVDAATLTFAPESFDAVVCLYTLIHLPTEEQHSIERSISTWLRPGGLLLATVGATAWTGEDTDWLGSGQRMWWSQPDADTYRRWLAESGLTITQDEFIPEGDGGHQLLMARRGDRGPDHGGGRPGDPTAQ